MANFGPNFLPPNFCKRCANNSKFPDMLVLVELQRIYSKHEYYTIATLMTHLQIFLTFWEFSFIFTPWGWRHSKNRQDNFDTNFKNIIGDALDTWQKTELAPYFEVGNKLFLRKTTDINVFCFHGQQNKVFELSK